jgi:hypothetical protein
VNHRGVYGPNWWGRHPALRNGRWGFWRRPWRSWWRPATWAGIGAWCTYHTWPDPIYYDYGGNVYYEDNSVYISGSEPIPEDEYAQQVAAVADAVPEDATVAEDDWMALGVFALLTKEDEDPNMFLQLAVSKEGIVAGTYHNASTDNAVEVQGTVDGPTQRAAWTVGENKNTVMETGIYNLTEEETPVLVHFSNGQTQQWLMVRLEEPEEGADAG